MNFYFVKNTTYHNLERLINIRHSREHFFGKITIDQTSSWWDQIVYEEDVYKIDNNKVLKLGYILGEDISELIREYKKWKL